MQLSLRPVIHPRSPKREPVGSPSSSRSTPDKGDKARKEVAAEENLSDGYTDCEEMSPRSVATRVSVEDQPLQLTVLPAIRHERRARRTGTLSSSSISPSTTRQTATLISDALKAFASAGGEIPAPTLENTTPLPSIPSSIPGPTVSDLDAAICDESPATRRRKRVSTFPANKKDLPLDVLLFAREMGFSLPEHLLESESPFRLKPLFTVNQTAIKTKQFTKVKRGWEITSYIPQTIPEHDI